MTIDPRRIAIIGFGEVGTAFARGLLASGRHEVTTYDILMVAAPGRSKIMDRAGAVGATPCPTAAEAAANAAVVISAVTASSAVAVAEEAGHYMVPGQIFLDINSVSPETKRCDARAVERSGADYVEAAVMAPVAPYGLKVPIILGGRRAADLKGRLAPAGMQLTVGDAEIGKASALKMCRSVMVKGFEALAVECLVAARLYGVEEGVLASLAESYPGIDWEYFSGYKIGRVIGHGRRRAAEMREAAETISETGMAPLMASATAGRIDWAADLVDKRPSLKDAPDADWRASLAAMAELADLRRLGQGLLKA